MAVVVQCFQCNAVLDLDDGFRGGVCRCSGCGSLLQVPQGEVEKAKRKSRPATPGLKISSNASAPTPAPEQPAVSRSARQKTDSSEEETTIINSGSSNPGLSPLQRTHPIAAASERQETGKIVEDQDPQPPVSPPTSTLVPRQEPATQTLEQNNKLLRTAWGLLILLAIVVVMSVVIYWSKGDQDNSGSATLPDRPSNTPPAGR